MWTSIAESKFVPDIDHQLACKVKLSSTLQASQLLLAIISNENFLCEHHLQTQQSTERQFYPYIFTGGMVKYCLNSICISCQLEYVSDPSQMCLGPTGTDRQTLSVACSHSQDKQTRSLSSSTSRNFNLIQMLDVSFLGVFSCISISWVNGNSYKQEFLEEIFFLSAYEVKDTTAAYLKGFSK